MSLHSLHSRRALPCLASHYACLLARPAHCPPARPPPYMYPFLTVIFTCPPPIVSSSFVYASMLLGLCTSLPASVPLDRSTASGCRKPRPESRELRRSLPISRPLMPYACQRTSPYRFTTASPLQIWQTQSYRQRASLPAPWLASSSSYV